MNQNISIIAVLKNEESLKFKTYSADDFFPIKDFTVKDLSKRTLTLRKKHYIELFGGLNHSYEEVVKSGDGVLLNYNRSLVISATVASFYQYRILLKRLNKISFIEKIEVDKPLELVNPIEAGTINQEIE